MPKGLISQMTTDEILSVTKILLDYLVPTVKIFGFTLLFSIPLGMIAAMLKMCRFKPISWLTNIYILVMRGTPLMLQVIAVYYIIPYLKLAQGLPAFMTSALDMINIRSENYMFYAVLTAFSLNYAAYFAEIFRYAKRSGGDLMAVIKNTAQIIQQKEEVMSEVDTIISGKKMEQRVMSLIPAVIVIYLKVTAKEFIQPLYGNIAGIIIMTVCLAVYVVSDMWAKRIVNIEV